MTGKPGLTLESIVAAKQGLVAAPMDDQLVMLDLAQGRYYGLDDIASLHPSVLYLMQGATGEDSLAMTASWDGLPASVVYWGQPIAGEFEGNGRISLFFGTGSATMTGLIRPDGKLAWWDAFEESPRCLPAFGDFDGDGALEAVGVGYLEDGPDLVAIAMNGWDEGHPAWWLNLRAHPHASIRLARQAPRPVQAREATGVERDRLWQRWLETDPELTAHAAHRTTETPVVILEPA